MGVAGKRMRPGRWLSTLLVAGVIGAAAADVSAAPARPGVKAGSPAGEATPALRLPGLDGRVHRLEDWRGRVVILNFWATWCPTCQYETPDLMRYQRDYGGSGLQVVGVGLDEARKLNNFRRTVGMNYPILRADPARSGALLAAWGDRKGVLPYTVVIDRDGQVVFRHVGRFNDVLFDDFVRPLLERVEKKGSSARLVGG